MELERAISGRRTIRRFKQEMLRDDDLWSLVNLARLSASAANQQPLRYQILRKPELVKAVFAHTSWGGSVKPRRNPVWGVSAPLCFIAVTAPAEAAAMVYADTGAAIETMLLAAYSRGIGSCWLGAFDKNAVRDLLGLPPGKQVLFLVALGYADEDPVQEEIDAGGAVKYYLDEADRIHVPKFKTNALIEWR